MESYILKSFDKFVCQLRMQTSNYQTNVHCAHFRPNAALSIEIVVFCVLEVSCETRRAEKSSAAVCPLERRPPKRRARSWAARAAPRPATASRRSRPRARVIPRPRHENKGHCVAGSIVCRVQSVLFIFSHTHVLPPKG
jgi:hypothetical protein